MSDCRVLTRIPIIYSPVAPNAILHTPFAPCPPPEACTTLDVSCDTRGDVMVCVADGSVVLEAPAKGIELGLERLLESTPSDEELVKLTSSMVRWVAAAALAVALETGVIRVCEHVVSVCHGRVPPGAYLVAAAPGRYIALTPRPPCPPAKLVEVVGDVAEKEGVWCKAG